MLRYIVFSSMVSVSCASVILLLEDHSLHKSTLCGQSRLGSKPDRSILASGIMEMDVDVQMKQQGIIYYYAREPNEIAGLRRNHKFVGQLRSHTRISIRS